MNQDAIIEDRNKAIKRHDLDSGIFQGRYVDFKLGKYTNEFIYGRYMLFEEVISDLAKLPAGSRVLDLGSGTGHLAKFIKDKGFEVVALEPSKEMLKHARNNFPDIEFVEGVSAEMPFKDNSFDYVVSIEVLRYFNPVDVIKTYQEIYRILKPGGNMMVTHVNTFASDFYFIYYHLVRFFKTVLGKFNHTGYFTDSAKEEKNLTGIGFSKAESTGRMFGSIRIGYKFGKMAGRMFAKFLELLDKEQVFKSNPRKSWAGHLIVRATK